VALAADDEVVPHLDDAGAAAEAVVVVLICPFTGVGFGFACVGTGGVKDVPAGNIAGKLAAGVVKTRPS